jgi:transposase-like protein
MRKLYSAEQRQQLIREVESGEPIRDVAKRLGICFSSAYRWTEEVRGSTGTAAPAFARVLRVAEPRPELVVEVGRAKVRVKSGFDVELLRGVVAALGEET